MTGRLEREAAWATVPECHPTYSPLRDRVCRYERRLGVAGVAISPESTIAITTQNEGVKKS